MAQQTTSRVEIRAALHAAGILTEHGRIVGTWMEVPDAPLFALIEEHDLHWSLYLTLYSRKGKTKADRERMQGYFETTCRIRDALAAMPPITLAGVRAKAAFGLDRLTNGGKSDGGKTGSLLVSALRDALRGPTAAPAPTDGNVVRLADHRADAVLIAKLEEMETARAIGRPEEPLGPGLDLHQALDSDRMVAVRRFMALEEEIAGIPAKTAPGITAKLQAAISRRKWPGIQIGAAAARDFLRLWEAWQ